MLLLVIVEDWLLILALISLVVLGPVMPRILVSVLLGNMVFFTGAEITRDDYDVVHSSGWLKLVIDSLVVVVIAWPLVVSTGIHCHWITLFVDAVQALA